MVWILRRRGHDLRPFLVEVDQALSDRVALDRIGAEQVRLSASLEHIGQFPTEVIRVLHGHVHALTGLGAMRVAGIAGDEHTRQASSGLAARARRRTGP